MTFRGLAPIAPEGEGIDVPFNRWLFFVDALRDRFPDWPTKYPFTVDWPAWYMPSSCLTLNKDQCLIITSYCFDTIIKQSIKTDLRPSKEHRVQADLLSKTQKKIQSELAKHIKGMSFQVINFNAGSPHLDYWDLGYLGVFFRCCGGCRVA